MDCIGRLRLAGRRVPSGFPKRRFRRLLAGFGTEELPF
jgi:hypothetical protein